MKIKNIHSIYNYIKEEANTLFLLFRDQKFLVTFWKMLHLNLQNFLKEAFNQNCKIVTEGWRIPPMWKICCFKIICLTIYILFMIEKSIPLSITSDFYRITIYQRRGRYQNLAWYSLRKIKRYLDKIVGVHFLIFSYYCPVSASQTQLNGVERTG